MLEDQLILRARLEQYGELIKAPDPPYQLCAVQQIDRDGCLLASREVEKRILDVLWSRL